MNTSVAKNARERQTVRRRDRRRQVGHEFVPATSPTATNPITSANLIATSTFWPRRDARRFERVEQRDQRRSRSRSGSASRCRPRASSRSTPTSCASSGDRLREPDEQRREAARCSRASGATASTGSGTRRPSAGSPVRPRRTRAHRTSAATPPTTHASRIVRRRRGPSPRTRSTSARRRRSCSRSRARRRDHSPSFGSLQSRAAYRMWRSRNASASRQQRRAAGSQTIA